MDTYGRLFNGGLVRFSMDEYLHAQHLLRNGGVDCDCDARGVDSHNGKFAAIAFDLAKPESMQDILLFPDDVIKTTATLQELVESE